MRLAAGTLALVLLMASSACGQDGEAQLAASLIRNPETRFAGADVKLMAMGPRPLLRASEAGLLDVDHLWAAFWLITRMPGCTPTLLEATESENADIREHAVAALSLLGEIGRLSWTRCYLPFRYRPIAVVPRQTFEETVLPVLERLALEDPVPAVRVQALTSLGMTRFPAARGSIRAALAEEDHDVRLAAAFAFGRTLDMSDCAEFERLMLEPRFSRELSSGLYGADPRTAAPAAALLLGSEDVKVSGLAKRRLELFGEDLSQQGTVLWWVLLIAHRWQVTGMLLLLVVWFLLVRHLPWRVPRSRGLRALEVGCAGAPPAVLTAVLVHMAVTQEWALGYLPKSPITVLDFADAAALTVFFCCGLAALGVQALRASRQELPVGSEAAVAG